jgi:hypothetical protein
MDPKLLTEAGWKTIVSKFKVKDNGLQRALASYEKLDEDEFAERQKALASVSQCAAKLQEDDAVAGAPEVLKYLDKLADTTEAEKRRVHQEKAAAEKNAKADAITAKLESAEAKKQEQLEGKYEAVLLAALQKVKSAPQGYEFIVCDGKPHCAVMVAKAITTQHKTQLTEMTDGSKRFLGVGTCRFESGKYIFGMERAPSGLARKIQASIQHFTGKKFAIVIGEESADEDVA